MLLLQDWIGQMILDKFKNNKRRKAIRTAPARSSGKRQREEIQAGEASKNIFHAATNVNIVISEIQNI